MSPAVPHDLPGAEIAKALRRAGFEHVLPRGATPSTGTPTAAPSWSLSTAPSPPAPCARSCGRPTGPSKTLSNSGNRNSGLDL